MNLTYFIKRLSCRKWLVSWFLNSNLTTSNVINANIISVCSIQAWIPDLDQDRPRKILEWRHLVLSRINWTVHFDSGPLILESLPFSYRGKVTEIQLKKNNQMIYCWTCSNDFTVVLIIFFHIILNTIYRELIINLAINIRETR